MTKKHACQAGCVCKAEEIAVIFVPGIMGTRLYNVIEGKVVWDPAKGLGLYDNGVIDMIKDAGQERIEKVEQEIKIAIDGALDEVKTGIGDRLKADTVDSVHGQANLAKIVAETTAKLKVFDGQLLEALEKKEPLIKTTQNIIANPLDLNLFDQQSNGILDESNKATVAIAKLDREIKCIQGQIDLVLGLGKGVNVLAQAARIGSGVFSLMSWMCADAIERKRVLVGKGSARDDNLLQVANDATIPYSPTEDRWKLFKYYGLWTSINPLKMFDYQQRGWGEICWPMYGEFLKKLQRSLDNKLISEPDSSSGNQQQMSADVSSVLKQVNQVLAQFGKKPEKTQAAEKDQKGDKKSDQGGKQASTDFDPYSDEKFALLMAGYKFSVYAVGYNWMQSNGLSGLRLKARISQILAETKIKKVIIVSHSMGGFVTRAAVVVGIDAIIPRAGAPKGDSEEAGENESHGENSAVADDVTGIGSSEREQKKIAKESAMAAILPQNSSQQGVKKAATSPPKPKSWDELKTLADQFKSEDVLAVIHGVMPTHGSPDTYARFRMGYYAPLSSPLEFVTGEVLGANAAEAVAILGYCQGAQELLPNDLYQRASSGHNWLCYQVADTDLRPQLLFKVKGKASQVGDVVESENIQSIDTIYDFYKEMGKKSWFRLISPPLLAPEYLEINDSRLEKYIRSVNGYLELTEKFHQQLADKFLDNKTAILYSTNVNDQSRDKAVWLGPATLTSADNPFSWQLKAGSIANSSGWWPLAKDKPYDDGKGTIFLAKEALSQVDDRLAMARNKAKPGSPFDGLMEFKLQAGDVPGDGTVHQGAGDNLRSNKKLYTYEGGFKCGEQHANFYSDQATFNKLRIRLKIYLGEHQSKKAAKR